MDGEAAQPPAVRVVNPQGSSRFVLLCEHASPFIPVSYKGLGLGAADLKRHIAWDIGAAVVAGDLARRLDATLILAGYSRLLIDLNRPLGSATSIPEISESTVIPGNLNLTADERRHRATAYFEPFQKGVAAVLDHRQRAGLPTTVIGIHSFTPVFKSVARPWHAGVLYRKSATFGHTLAEALGGAKANIAENEPYQIEDSGDYTVPVHGEARGLEAALIEIRQDLIAEDAGAAAWAAKLADAAARLDWQR